MLIGRSTAGKTTLCQRIFNEDIRYHKTQTVTVEHEVMIDTPGDYLERRGYRGALMVTSADADIILGLIENTHSVYSYDPDILDIITDEVAAFFAGEKSAADTAAMVQSRVNLYVQEQS